MKADLTTGPISPALIRMGLPMFIGIFAIIFINVVDIYFISQLGEAQLAGVTYTFPVITIITNLAMGLGAATSSLVSRCYGAKDSSNSQSYTTMAILLAFSIGVLFGIVGIATINPLFTALGADASSLKYTAEYMNIWYLGMPLVLVPMVGNYAIRAIGNAKFSGMVMILAAIVNLILDPILIFGLLGAPALGVKGAAIATIASYFMAFLAGLYFLHFKARLLKLRLSFKYLKDITKLALPNAANNLLTPITLAVMIKILSTYGDDVVAAMGIITRIESLFLLVFMAMSSALNAFIGQNYGAKKYIRIQQATKITVKFSIIYGLICCVLLLLLGKSIGKIFSIQHNIITVTNLYFIIVPISYIFIGIIITSNSNFNAIGKPQINLKLNLVRYFVLQIPCAYILSISFGIGGVFIGILIANLVIGLFALKLLNNCNKTI